MFTGIVETTAPVVAVQITTGKGRLTLDLGSLAEGSRVGDSVCVSGACLTITSLNGSIASFDASAETLSRTTLGALRPGSIVNLERALSAGGRLGGHFVQGHVDAVGLVRSKKTQPGQWTVDVAVSKETAGLLVMKGSVTVDGVSLTVCGLGEDGFTVALIPHTVAATTLKDMRVGDRVNVETDILGKYVARLLGRGAPGQGITEEFLSRHGFTIT